MLPPKLFQSPTDEQKQEAEAAWMEYKPVYISGVLQYWKLYHKKQQRPCNCGNKL